MTLDEEIMLAKREKDINEKSILLMETLEYGDSSEESLLQLKYCETAEMLREFDYNGAIFEVLKESKNYEKINFLKEEVAVAMSKVSSSNLQIVLEGYLDLSKHFIRLFEMLKGPVITQYKRGGEAVDKVIDKNNLSDIGLDQVNTDIKRYYDEGGEDNYQKLRKHGMSDRQIERVMMSISRNSKKK